MTTRSRVHQDFGKRREPPRISYTSNGKVRALTLNPALVVSLIGGFALFTVIYLGATAYLLFRDDLVGAAITRQIDMRHGYEDRIAALRAQIDRIQSRQVLDQSAFEARIDRLTARQDGLREFESRIGAVLDKARQQGMKLPLPTSAATEGDVGPSKPLKASTWFAPAGGRADGTDGRVTARIDRAEASIDRMAQRQTLALAALAEMAERDAGRIEAVVAKLGLRFGSLASADKSAAPRPHAVEGGVGGPLVPMIDPAVAAWRAETALDRLADLRRNAAALPLGVPVRGDAQVTSGFGGRSDPFLGVLAMHTGIDFRADLGDPVIATGPGQIEEAGRQGGYGLMVEIDHGNGISTRFGHLSRIAVEAGQTVRAGQVIGYAGSTGRSTGPHVHYETRLNGDAVNPAAWLDAGEKLRPVLH